jgi:hypothetical protein
MFGFYRFGDHRYFERPLYCGHSRLSFEHFLLRLSIYDSRPGGIDNLGGWDRRIGKVRKEKIDQEIKKRAVGLRCCCFFKWNRKSKEEE